TTIVRSGLSFFAAAGAVAAAGILVAGGVPEEEPVGLAAGGVCPGFAGAVAAGLFVCDEGGGAFGAKNFAHAIITNIDNSEATSMRSSGRRPLFFCGSVTKVSRPSGLRC